MKTFNYEGRTLKVDVKELLPCVWNAKVIDVNTGETFGSLTDDGGISFEGALPREAFNYIMHLRENWRLGKMLNSRVRYTGIV